jgi:phage terminase large subunit
VQRCARHCKAARRGHDCWACDDCVTEWTEPKPRAIICDHDAEDRATLERHLGMSTVAADKRVKVGLEAVQTRTKRAGDGRPRIFLLADALLERDEALEEAKKPACTEEEVPGYVWDPGTAAARAAEKPPKEAPLKENDHGCDGMRYVVAERDLGGRPRIRTL